MMNLSFYLGASVTEKKQAAKCTPHKEHKSFFHPPSKELGCFDCLATRSFAKSELIDAREFCDNTMHRYFLLLDNAFCMPNEHVQKEKEYGIAWRSAFKTELAELVIEQSRLSLKNQHVEDIRDPFETLGSIIRKAATEAASFD
jgi:hypothetical protein